MGNCSTPSFQEVDDEYRTFVEMCCEESPEAYATYSEYCTIFSIFLQRHCMHRLSESRPKGLKLQEWGDTVSMRYINKLCKTGKLVRYGEFGDTALLLNVRVLRLFPAKTWVDL